MEKYNIIKLSNGQYDYLVIANTYENPINDFLSDEKVPNALSGNVVFDLMLINGIKPNRYVSAQVIKSKIDASSIKPTSNVDDEIKSISREYFINNASLVRNSALPNALKYSILNM